MVWKEIFYVIVHCTNLKKWTNWTFSGIDGFYAKIPCNTFQQLENIWIGIYHILQGNVIPLKTTYIFSSSKTIDMNIKLCRYYVYFCLWKKDFWQWEETLHLTCIPNKIIYVYLSTQNYEWILLWMCIRTPCTFMYFFAPIIAFGQKILAKQIAKWDLLAMQTTF